MLRRWMSSVVGRYGGQSDFTGLKVDPLASEKLQTIYKETLKMLKEMPEGYAYRSSMEGTLMERIAKLDTGESGFGEGIVEVMVEQAGEELTLIQKMITWRSWEPL